MFGNTWVWLNALVNQLFFWFRDTNPSQGLEHGFWWFMFFLLAKFIFFLLQKYGEFHAAHITDENLRLIPVAAKRLPPWARAVNLPPHGQERQDPHSHPEQHTDSDKECEWRRFGFTCQHWQRMGIECKHAIDSMKYNPKANKNNEDVIGEYADFKSHIFRYKHRNFMELHRQKWATKPTI